MPLEWNARTERELRFLKEARRLRHRVRCISWCRSNGLQHVTMAQAAYILSTSHGRVQELVKGGRLRVLQTPEAWRGPRILIAVDSLLDAPSGLETGRPILPWTWPRGEDAGFRDGPNYNPWGKSVARPQNTGNRENNFAPDPESVSDGESST